MTNVLIVTALELRDPVALGILMKTGDSLLHVLRLALVEAARSRKAFPWIARIRYGPASRERVARL